MVIKPYAGRPERDRRRAAGRSAEEQMAHYLDRHFGESKTIHVLHDLRIEYDGDHAQMDHLVLHQFGAAIVESKSVTTAVKINEAGEWARSWNGRWKGMPDPLLQGQRQGVLLKRLLAARADILLDSIVFGLIQGTFTHMALDVFAGIADSGVIERARPTQAANALKADAVPLAIVETIGRHRKATSLLNFKLKSVKEAPRDFKEGEVLRVAHFLREHHVEAPAAPREAPPQVRPPVAAVTPAVAPDRAVLVTLTCKKCGSRDLEPLIGRYGPYGRCRSCGTNTAVGRECPNCRERTRFERADGGFAGTCESCEQTTSIQVGAG
jgi:hypothetical protein